MRRRNSKEMVARSSGPPTPPVLPDEQKTTPSCPAPRPGGFQDIGRVREGGIRAAGYLPRHTLNADLEGDFPR